MPGQKNAMIRKLLLFIFTTALLSVASCKKYEDGGYHTTAGYMIAFRWTLNRFTVDGHDSLSRMDAHYLKPECFNIIREKHQPDNFRLLINDGAVTSLDCNLAFQENRSRLYFYPPGFAFSQYPFYLDTKEWQIRELSSKTLKLKLVNYVTQKDYELEFNR